MKKRVIDVFNKYNINQNELKRYNEPHRFYHNWEHIEIMLNDAKNQNVLSDELLLAIVFHDIIYNPKNNDNEILSANIFEKYIKNDIIKQAILDTKTHIPTNDLSEKLCELDLNILYSDFNSFVDYEHKIFKEYQFVDYNIYKENRIKFLLKYNVKEEYINYVKNRNIKIGLYCGSFNPFHIGHYNILQKAENIFDKVIIARGKNPEKENILIDLPEKISNRQIELYNGLMTDFIQKLNYDVTLIRGLRNENDFHTELIQYRYLQDLYDKINVVYLFCDKEYEHISSSSCRMLKNYDKHHKYLI